MKKTKNILFLISYVLIIVSIHSCSVNKAHIDNDLKSFYDSEKTAGCFTMLDNATGQITVYNMGMDTTRYAPGATFEILNNLIALQTGAITNANDSITIGNVNDSNAFTMNMNQAFEGSVIDYTKFVVAKTGKEIMQKWIDSLSYGNKTIGDTAELFWSNNKLLISPDEQLGLLKRLYFDQLPFRKSVQEAVRNMMMQEDNSAFRLSYKTATITSAPNKTMSWHIGWIEENRHVYFFVNLVANNTADKNPGETAVTITKNILTHYGFFKGLK